jgi:hypothetical protein
MVSSQKEMQREALAQAAANAERTSETAPTPLEEGGGRYFVRLPEELTPKRTSTTNMIITPAMLSAASTNENGEITTVVCGVIPVPWDGSPADKHYLLVWDGEAVSEITPLESYDKLIHAINDVPLQGQAELITVIAPIFAALDASEDFLAGQGAVMAASQAAIECGGILASDIEALQAPRIDPVQEMMLMIATMVRHFGAHVFFCCMLS